MEDMLAISRKRKELRQQQKEIAANVCYSAMMIMGALLLLRPLMVDQLLSRADAYSDVGLTEECRRQCNKALLIDSESSQAWCRLARIYKAAGDREMALGLYQKAAQSDSTSKPAQSELGAMYLEDGLYELAIPCFEQVRTLGPDRTRDLRRGTASYHRNSLEKLALCYEKIGDRTKLEFMLEELRVFYPGYGHTGERLEQLKNSQPRSQ